MNNVITQGDGFPADNEFLMFMKNMILDTAQIAGLGGTSYILKGCEVVGGNANPGWMVLAGEIIPFQGGALGTQVTIIQEIENASYLEDLNNDNIGDSKQTYFTRYARFGNDGVATFTWADLKTIRPIVELQKAVTPVGGIIMYSGVIGDIPEGWHLCDGSNGTPDLAGRFIVGYNAVDIDYNVIGATGGSKEVTLTEAQMPQHNHSGTTSSNSHSHGHKDSYHCESSNSYNAISGHEFQGTTFHGSGDTDNDNDWLFYKNRNTDPASHSHTITTNNRGSGQAHENRPPYFTLAFIMYTGV